MQLQGWEREESIAELHCRDEGATKPRRSPTWGQAPRDALERALQPGLGRVVGAPAEGQHAQLVAGQRVLQRMRF